jgi:GAF domain-containing protein
VELFDSAAPTDYKTTLDIPAEATARPALEAIPARAMATASNLFAGLSETAGTSETLLRAAAELLASDPGSACLVCVADADAGLQPLTIAHANPHSSRGLQRTLSRARQLPPDAFSCLVARSGGAMRMAIFSPHLLELWLPVAYWAYAERAGISSVLAAALVQHGHVRGTLLLWREGAQAAFNEADQAYVAALAARLALAL